ncbi:ATP-binding protein [Modestobacter lacusdianchii]
MNEATRTPADYAQAYASWHEDTPVPGALDARLTLQLGSLRGLSAVRQQVQVFLLASLDAESDGVLSLAAEDSVEQAILVIDELTSNALRHGDPPSTLHIADQEGRWVVIVTDSAPDRLPTPARERPAGQGGYGLYLIADLTTAHGVHRDSGRKMVWVSIHKPS